MASLTTDSTANQSRVTSLDERENLHQSPRSKYFCGHCNRKLTKTLYFKHKKLYYDIRAKSWNKERVYQHYDGFLREFSMSTVSAEESGDITKYNEMECKSLY